MIIGSPYALVGSGIALIYGTMRVLNLVHGEFYMLGGYLVFFLVVSLRSFLHISRYRWRCWLPFFLGAIIQRLTIHYLLQREGGILGPSPSRLACRSFFTNSALLLFGENVQSVPYYVTGIVEFAGVRILQRLLIPASRS